MLNLFKSWEEYVNTLKLSHEKINEMKSMHIKSDIENEPSAKKSDEELKSEFSKIKLDDFNVFIDKNK